MKGHPGSGKSTAARAIAAALRCPLLDKDDIRDCTLPLEGAVGRPGCLTSSPTPCCGGWSSGRSGSACRLLWTRRCRAVLTLTALTCLPAALVVIVECRAVDEEEWRRRLEERGASVVNGGGGGGWHKPKTWGELQKLVEGYQGCTDYETLGMWQGL
ncbi:hypothetical protein PR202_ga28314 [Eleusine coracana subsp. coracana]|uniref:Adenylate kinase n=1 Tax=Eleusine coracana subsp. coracana TaxID=191504 RepID=A0AAV5DJA2_ELECO|nr:hypothetical protein PR202_ga28314 [Eleusine coracana subsp. coracana]